MRTLTAIPLLLCGLIQAALSQDIDPILIDAEISRGVLSTSGVEWNVTATSQTRGETNVASLHVMREGRSTIAEFLSPEGSAGKKFLVQDNDMWFYRPGANRAVRVPRQNRISGDAAIGDIASSSFLHEYEVESTEDVMLGDTGARLYTLVRKEGQRPSYSKIRLWVSLLERVSLKAEFLGTRDKLVRTAVFQHDERVTVNGKSMPFLSRLEVEQGVGTAQTTILEFSDYAVRDFPDSVFTVDALISGE